MLRKKSSAYSMSRLTASMSCVSGDDVNARTATKFPEDDDIDSSHKGRNGQA